MSSDAAAMISQAIGQGEPVELDGDEVRGKLRDQEYDVTTEALQAYAAATEDTREVRGAGAEASPAYGFVPVTKLLFDTIREVVGELTPTGLVHTHQEFWIEEPIRGGDHLVVTAGVADLRQGPFGGVVKVLADTRRGGTLLNRQLVTGLVVGSRVLNPIEDPAYATPEAASGRPAGGSATIAIARDHTERYAAASGDTNPMHLDPGFARSQGFPGAIMHGVGTLAIACSAIEAQHPDRTDASGLAVEWARPVFPGDRLTVRWQDERDGLGCRFDVVNRKLRTVLRGGRLSWRG